MTLKIYGIKNCDTMKKAFAWLEANAVAFEFVDYKKTALPKHIYPTGAPVPAGKRCSTGAA